jgi:hypothetical protein
MASKIAMPMSDRKGPDSIALIRAIQVSVDITG